MSTSVPNNDPGVNDPANTQDNKPPKNTRKFPERRVGPRAVRVPGNPKWQFDPDREIAVSDLGEVLDPVPIVVQTYARFVGRSITQVSVQLRVGEIEHLVSMKDVADGSCWSLFPGRLRGAGAREYRDLFHNLILLQQDADRIASVTPRWVDGRLELPAVMTHRYGEVLGTREEFVALMRQAARSPKLSFVLGFVIGGLFMEPLRMESFLVHLPGNSHTGKSTALQLCASLVGVWGPAEDAGIIRKWNASEKGATGQLRDLACLPAFRDELGMAKFRTSDLHSTVLRITEGATRELARKDTSGPRAPTGGWRGVMVINGNEGIVERIADEAIAKRVIEVEGPFGADAEHGERMRDLVTFPESVPSGWGLRLVREAGVTPEQFAELWRTAVGDLGAVPGGVARSMREKVAVSVAGSRVLAELAGVPELADQRVLDAARETLDTLVSGLMERGQSPGEVALQILSDSLASMPDAFPTRHGYDAAQAEFAQARLPREVFGWDLSGDGGVFESWHVAVVPSHFRSILDRGGVIDPNIALKDLRRLGLLKVPKEGRTRTLQQRIDVGRQDYKPRAYVIRFYKPETEAASDGNGSSSGGEGGSVPTSPDSGALQFQHSSNTGSNVETRSDLHSSNSSSFSGDEIYRETPIFTNSSVEGGFDHSPSTVANSSVEAHSDNSSWSPCRECAEPASPWCGGLDREDVDAVACVVCGTPTTYRSGCGVPRHPHLWGVGSVGYGDAIDPGDLVEPPGTEREALADWIPEVPGSWVWSEPSGTTTSSRRRKRRERSEGETSYLSKWAVKEWPEAAPEDTETAERLWSEAMAGLEFKGPWETAQGILMGSLKHHNIPVLPEFRQEWLEPLDEGSMFMRQPGAWMCDPGTDIPVGGRLGEFDITGMYVGAANCELGTGEPERFTELPERWEKMPGWVRLARRPKKGVPYGLRERLDPGMWVPTPVADYLREKGLLPPSFIKDALLWPKHRRWMRTHRELFRKGLASLHKAPESLGRTMAEVAVKQTYARLFGAALRSTAYPTGVLRPDWANMITATGLIRMWINLDKMTDDRFRVVGFFRDSAWILLPEGDEPPGLELTPTCRCDGVCEHGPEDRVRTLGKFKVSNAPIEVTSKLAQAHQANQCKPVYRAFSPARRES